MRTNNNQVRLLISKIFLFLVTLVTLLAVTMETQGMGGSITEKERDSSSILDYFRRQGDTWSEAFQAYFAAEEGGGENEKVYF